MKRKKKKRVTIDDINKVIKTLIGLTTLYKFFIGEELIKIVININL